MKKEHWKAIKDYVGLYEVSDWGNVRSLDRVVVNTNGRKTHYKGRGMRLSVIQDGYLQVGLCKNGKQKKHRVHILVHEAFIGEIQNGLEIDHDDDNKKNNHYLNLEAVTHAENMDRAKKSGLMGVIKGERQGQSRLTENDVVFVRTFHHLFTQTKLAALLGVHQATIWRAINNKSWSHLN